MLLMFYMLILFVQFDRVLFSANQTLVRQIPVLSRAGGNTASAVYLALAGVDRRMQTRQLIALTGIYRFPGFGWISFVLDSIEPPGIEKNHSDENDSLRARLVDQAWIEDQYRYFTPQGRGHAEAPLLDRATQEWRVSGWAHRAFSDVYVRWGATPC